MDTEVCQCQETGSIWNLVPGTTDGDWSVTEDGAVREFAGNVERREISYSGHLMHCGSCR